MERNDLHDILTNMAVFWRFAKINPKVSESWLGHTNYPGIDNHDHFNYTTTVEMCTLHPGAKSLIIK